MNWCYCGRPLLTKMGITFCEVHGKDYNEKTKPKKIGRYSGKSKTPYGGYESR